MTASEAVERHSDWDRHPADLARFILSTAITLGLVGFSKIFERPISHVSIKLIQLLQMVPDGLTFALVGLVQLVVTVAIPLALMALAINRKWRFIGLLGVAAALGGATMAALERFLSTDLPSSLERSRVVESWVTGSAYPSAALLAAGAAIITATAPFVPRSWMRIGTVAIVAISFLRVLTATEIPMNLALILAVGICTGSLALVITGAPHRRIDPKSITDTLARIGITTDAISLLGDERGALSFHLQHPNLADTHVALLGRDQRDQDIVLRAWRAMRVKGFHSRRPVGSPRRTAANEQLALTIAQANNVAVSPPIAIGSTADDAALSVTGWIEGIALGDVAADEIPDRALTSLWQQVLRLHDRRIAHGWLNIDSVLLVDQEPKLVGFRWATINASDKTLCADVAELLCSLAAHIGIDRAVSSACTGMDAAALNATLPLLQPLVISSETRDVLKTNTINLGELRAALQEAIGADAVELAPVSRVSLKGVVSLVGSIVLVSYVFTLASDWRSIADAFGTMNWAAVPLLLGLVLAINAGGSLSMMGSVNVELPFFRTNQIMFAQGFLNRFTPANAGGMALRARYLQREGVELNIGAAAVGLTSVVSGLLQVVLLVVFLVWGGSSDELSRFSLPSASKVLGVAIAIGVVVGAIALSSWGKRVVVPKVKATAGPAVRSLGELAKQPTKLAQLLGGTTLAKLGTIVAFALCVSAMGIDMSFVRIGALYMVANTIGSAVPTPGGVGGIEAALTAALISAGVDPAEAGAIVLIFRLFTFWFPTLPGWACLQRAQRTGIV